MQRLPSYNQRHLPQSDEHIKQMLDQLGYSNFQNFLDALIPNSIKKFINKQEEFKNLKPFESQTKALNYIQEMGYLNKCASQKIMIGQGFNPAETPMVLKRNFLEDHSWYSAYTPYQAEISQGRLELLLYFQQMIMDLSGFDLANASLLDEATASAEAMAFSKRISKSKSNKYFVDDSIFQNTIKVLQTRAKGYGFEIIVGKEDDYQKGDFFGAIFQYTDQLGKIRKFNLKDGVINTLICDPLSLVLLKSPFELGFDVAVGSTQRFGLPLGFGGPHSAFFATKSEFKRSVPGRIIGVTKDSKGRKALRMALQTREQHIRREKATSNICTSQVLLANLSALYSIWHGAEGLKKIALKINELSLHLASLIRKKFDLVNTDLFDSVVIKFKDKSKAEYYYKRALEKTIFFIFLSILMIIF